jgi:hypothetical protein
MLHEAAQELLVGERPCAALAVMSVIFPSESDGTIVHRQQSVIGDGHAMGVASTFTTGFIREATSGAEPRAATGAEVGSHALVSAGYAGSEHWRMCGGHGYLFPGEYLRQSGYLTALRTSYLLFSFSL